MKVYNQNVMSQLQNATNLYFLHFYCAKILFYCILVA